MFLWRRLGQHLRRPGVEKDTPKNGFRKKSGSLLAQQGSEGSPAWILTDFGVPRASKVGFFWGRRPTNTYDFWYMFCDFLQYFQVFVRNGITLQSMFSYRLLCQKDHPAVDKVLKFIITGWGEFPKVVNLFPVGTEDWKIEDLKDLGMKGRRDWKERESGM